MTLVEAAHRRAAASYERAAALHDRTAEMFDGRELPQLADRERERARFNRDGAAAEHELARLRRDWIARAAARGARQDPLDVAPDPPTM